MLGPSSTIFPGILTELQLGNRATDTWTGNHIGCLPYRWQLNLLCRNASTYLRFYLKLSFQLCRFCLQFIYLCYLHMSLFLFSSSIFSDDPFFLAQSSICVQCTWNPSTELYFVSRITSLRWVVCCQQWSFSSGYQHPISENLSSSPRCILILASC